VYWYFVSTDRTTFHSLFAPGTDVLLSHIERTVQFMVDGAYMVHSNVELDARQLEYLLWHFGSPDHTIPRGVYDPLMVRAIQFTAQDNGTCVPRISDKVIAMIGKPVKFTYNKEMRWERYDSLLSERPLAIVEFVVAASMFLFDEFSVERFALLVFATLLLVLPRSVDALVESVIHKACATTSWVGKLLLSCTSTLARGALGCGKFAMRAVKSTVGRIAFFVTTLAAALAVYAKYVAGVPARALVLSVNASGRGLVASVRKANIIKINAAQLPYPRFDLEIAQCSDREAAEGASVVETAKLAAADLISVANEPRVENLSAEACPTATNETPPTTSEGTVGVAAAQGTSERPSAGVRPASTAKRSTLGPAMRLALAQKLYQAGVERSRTTTAAEGRSAKPAAASFGPRAKQQRNQQGRSGSVKTRPATTKKCAALRDTTSSTTTQPSAAPEPRRRSHRLLGKH
jgi:hypothetical protein